ncbi:hypothetical protein JMG10_02240 [Nostoc ellipsosporum NOK]|nr:hypothetical protein [Nostoc ellipsosporum NOK]
MKKNALYTAAFLFLFGAAQAQTDSLTTTTAMPSSTAQVYANYKPKSAELLPMPEALTTEKVFPAIGKYQVTDKDGNNADLTITMDPENKGIVWIEGLPQGKIKALLKKSPAVYKIPAQAPAAEEAIVEETEAVNAASAKKAKAPAKAAAKTIPEGTLIYDRDNNTVNIVLGTKYNEEDPAAVFAPAEATQIEADAATTKKTAKKPVKKAPVAKTWKYSGTKIMEPAASTSADEAMPATQPQQ